MLLFYIFLIVNKSHEKTKANNVLVCLSVLYYIAILLQLPMVLCYKPICFLGRSTSLKTAQKYVVSFFKRAHELTKRAGHCSF